MNQPQVLLAQRTHLDTRLCQRMCHLPTKQEPDTPTKDAPVQNSVRSCHRQVFSAHNNRIDWDKTCPYAHSRVDTLRKLSQRRLRRSLESQALHYKEGSSSIERVDLERERGNGEETSNRWTGDSTCCLRDASRSPYIHTEGSPNQRLYIGNILYIKHH